ncbi:DUF1266 domain-containing protein [Streptomyces sp. NPDC048636]|uniref:DUF1266 domain-containing protein n=1 Tax=Streptomyces sp. NPDC048636 TaxID=3155762 RepID=UPI00342B2A55
MHVVSEDELHDEFFPSIPSPESAAGWQAPTELEQHLYKLSRADNGYAYLRTLATEGVYYPVRLDHAREAAEDEYPMLTVDTSDGRVVAQVYTAGVLPRPHPYLVYEYATLGALAHVVPEQVDVLAVNAATPCEHFFLTDDEEREVWLDLHHELFEPDELMDRVVTRRTRVPEPGALLHGLACGAHLCFRNGDAWNTAHWHGMGYQGEVTRISRDWGVDSREDWLRTQEGLLERELSSSAWNDVLGARNMLLEGANGATDHWRDHVEASLRAGARRSLTPTDDPDFMSMVARARDLVGKILRYEARFRADGLLPPDGIVRSAAAWDIGRASKMARWGLGARYATETEAHTALERASRRAQEIYGSWEEFSAGYILGRCLHFDEEHFGSWYTTVLEAHRELTTDPDSPWLTVPFTTP